MAAKVHLDGRIQDLDQARVPATDHGFLFGDSVFETLRALDGRCAFAAEHLRRLRLSAAACHLAVPWTDVELEAVVTETVAACGAADAAVRVVVTRGSGPPEPDPAPCRTPRLLVLARERRPLPEAVLRDGAAVIVSRRVVSARGAHAKTGNYLASVLALGEAREAGAFEAILLNDEGRVAECSGANVFAVLDGTVVTPPVEEGLLAGISRAHVLQSCLDLGLPAQERPLWPEELAGATEAFLTSTLKEVVAISSVDGRSVPAIGPTTRALLDAHRRRLLASTRP